MAVYKVEATKPEMVQEALIRMRLLKLDEQTIKEFETAGRVFLSRHMDDKVCLESADAEMTAHIKAFEKEYECLVYHAHHCYIQMVGDMWSLLFVSPAASDWESEKQYLQDYGLVYAYVDSDMESGISEIQVKRINGAIDRIG